MMTSWARPSLNNNTGMLQGFYDPEFDACKYTLEQTEGQSLMDLEEFRDARFEELHVRTHARSPARTAS